MSNNKKKPKTLKQLRKSIKVRTLRDNLDFVPEPPGPNERERDEEYSQDNWDIKAKALGPNSNSLMGDAPTPKDIKSIHKKLDALDAKLEFLLKYLEL